MANEEKPTKGKGTKKAEPNKKEKQNDVVSLALKDVGLVKDTTNLAKIPKKDAASGKTGAASKNEV